MHMKLLGNTVRCSGSSLDDVSLASWWSAVEVTSVDVDRKTSFAHLSPSDTYVKAWYKLRELEVALCSVCLSTDQVRHAHEGATFVRFCRNFANRLNLAFYSRRSR